MGRERGEIGSVGLVREGVALGGLALLVLVLGSMGKAACPSFKVRNCATRVQRVDTVGSTGARSS